jgi:hypothetical protein
MPCRWRRLRRSPAVSTRTNVRPSRASTVSIESRVVPGHLRDDHPLAPDERVQERRLADVRAAEDRDRDRLLADRPPRRAGSRDDLVEQVARAVAVQRRDRDRVAEPEPVELERLEVAPRVVELVREHEHGLVATAQDLRELLVARRDPASRRRRAGRGRPPRSPPRLRAICGRTARVRRDPRRPCRSSGTSSRPLAEELLAVARDPGVSWTTAVAGP